MVLINKNVSPPIGCDHHHHAFNNSQPRTLRAFTRHTSKHLSPSLTRHQFIHPPLKRPTHKSTNHNDIDDATISSTPTTTTIAHSSDPSIPFPSPTNNDWNILDAPGLAVPRSETPRNDPLSRLLRFIHLNIIAILVPPLASIQLLQRVCFTLSMIFFIRIGHYIAVPGMNMSKILSFIPHSTPSLATTTTAAAIDSTTTTAATNVASITSQLTGSFELSSNIYTLGIAPYMMASVVLAAFNILPSIRRHFKELRDEGRPGREVMNSYLTATFLIIAIGNAYTTSGLLVEQAAAVASSSGGLWLFRLQAAVTLMAGAVLCKYVVQVIDQWGVGDGVGVFIGTGIALNYVDYLRGVVWPALVSIMSYFSAVAASTPPLSISSLSIPPYISNSIHIIIYTVSQTYPLLITSFATIAMYLCFIIFVVWVQGTELRLPLTFFSARRSASQINHPVLNDLSRGVDARSALELQSLLPLRLSPSGTRQLLFANFWVSLLNDPLKWLGIDPILLQNPFIFAIFVFILEAVSIADATPKQMAEFLSSSDIGIRGISPGVDTERFLSKRRAQMKFINAGFIALVSLAARAIDAVSVQLMGVSFNCLLILLLVSTVLGGARQVDALGEGVKIEKKLEEEYRFLEGLLVDGSRK